MGKEYPFVEHRARPLTVLPKRSCNMAFTGGGGEIRKVSTVAAVPRSPRCQVLLDVRVILSPYIYMVVTNVGLLKCLLFTAFIVRVR